MNSRFASRQAFLFCKIAGIFLLLATSLAAVAQWQQGFDFRNTAAFVSDPSGDTGVLAATKYPTTEGGVTFGWVKTSLVQGRDRNAKLDPRLAGVNLITNGAPATFNVDLPSPGTYNLSLAMGDAGYEECWKRCQIQFLDGNTVLATLIEGVTNMGYFFDATGNNWSAATWPTNNVSQQVTLTGVLLTVVVGTNQVTGDFTPIAFLGVAQVSGSPNFAISVSPASLSVAQGNQGTSTVTTAIGGGFNSAIGLSASGVPSGTTVSFNPQTIPAPGSGNSTMTITVGGSTPVGTYPITVTGNGGGIQQNTTVMLTVTAQQQPNFTISASPASLSVQQGNQGTSTITTAISGGFDSSISLSASGMPSGTTVSFNPQTIPAPGSGNSTMTITVGGSTPTGTYPITVTGNGGGIQQNTTVMLTVTAQQQPNFAISASPASFSVAQGNQGTSTISATISGGFNSAIGLSASGIPSGTTVSFNPQTIPAPGSGNSTMTIIVGGSTPTGTYPITVTGNGGGIQQNTTVTLTVTSAMGQQAAEVSGIATLLQSGQTCITYTEPYTNATNPPATNMRYVIYRQNNTADCPITSANLASATQIEEIGNNGGQLNPHILGASDYTETYRDDPTQLMSITAAGGSPLNAFTGLAVYTAVANGSACYGVVTHDASGTLTDSAPVSTLTISETTAANPMVVDQLTPGASGRGFSPDGHSGQIGMYYFHASASPDDFAGSAYGYLSAYWGNTNMGWQDGVQSLMTAYWDTDDYYDGSTAIPVIAMRPSDGNWIRDPLWYNFKLASTIGIESFWTGYEYNSAVYPWTLNKLNFIMPWAVNRWSPNPNKIFAYGVSMGGTALGSWAIRQGNIALILAQRPVWSWVGKIWSQTTGGVLKGVGNEILVGTGQTYFNYADVATWISNNCGSNLPFIETAMGRTDSTLDYYSPGYMFTNEVNVIAALKGCHSGYAFAWNNEAHGNEPDLNVQLGNGDTSGKLFGFYITAMALNQSYPAFFNFSLDNNYGPGGDCSSGSATCLVNAGWHWSNITDTSSTWSATITNPNITSTATSDLTPRNAQNFRLVAGQSFTWTATGGQNGSGNADAYGLANVTGITFTSSPTTVTFTAGLAQSRVSAPDARGTTEARSANAPQGGSEEQQPPQVP